ncbi:MAG TPA: hypothetical protein VH042_05655 [Solirubrobacterales bacterium]|nr:hypothetical protein [Solirubrobacterales bacterium]
MTPARIAIWTLSIGAVVLILLILGGSEGAQQKVGWATLLFLIFSLNSLPGLLLIQRRPRLVHFGATALALSVATYFVLLDSLFAHGWFEVHTAVGILLLLAVVAGQASMLLAFGRDEDSPLVNATLAGSLVVLALVVVLGIVSITGTHIGDRVYGTLAVLYLLGALLPPFLRWEQAEQT